MLLVHETARRLHGERAGWLAAGVLIGSMIFARHARLAETDILATVFITAGILCIWRGADLPGRISEANWHRLSGLLIALAVMSKVCPPCSCCCFSSRWRG